MGKQGQSSSLPKTVGVWLRVSTEDQVKGESLEHHEKRARMYCEARGWTVTQVYRLDAVSGKAVLGHAEARRMLADARSGKIEALLFSKLARLARNTKELLDIADQLGKCGVDMISLQEAIDTSSPAGRLFFTIIAGMAQWEREEIGERVAASVPIRAKLGKQTGGAAPFGYRWNKQKQLEIDPNEGPVRVLVHELYAEHKRRKLVARILTDRGYRTRNGSKFSDTTVERLLRDPVAKGVRRANYTKTSDRSKAWEYKPESEWVLVPVPALISEELWTQCVKLLDERKSADPRTRVKRAPAHLFSGVTWCHCGGKMFMGWHSPKYVCRKCRAKIVAEDLEAVFKEQLRGYVLSPEELSSQLNLMDEDISEKQRLIEATEREMKRVSEDIEILFDLYKTKALDAEDFSRRHKPLAERYRELENEFPRLQAELDVAKVLTLNKEEIAFEAKDLTERWSSLPQEDRQSIVNNIVNRITVGKDEIDIDLVDIPYLSSSQISGQEATHRHGFIAATSCTREG